ncbi:MAG: YqaJ viral recombinase family protein [Nitrobacter sp.]
MPDPLKKTISATEAPALWNVSPYVTRWMLWQAFANAVDLNKGADGRMSWGLKMQPLVLEQAAEELRLEVRPNEGDVYHRRGLLGCTRDATIICPDRGPGALETKCVFDYGTWMREWDGGTRVPRHYEIQLQQQMLVGDENPYEWGVIAAWVGGEQHYFERKPIPDLWEKLNTDAAAFFKSVEVKDEPEPFGAVIEIPWLTELLPTIEGNPLDLSGEPSAEALSNDASMFNYHQEQESGHKKAREALRAKFLAVGKDHDEIRLPFGANIRISTTKGAAPQKRLKVYVPETPGAGAPRNNNDVLAAG